MLVNLAARGVHLESKLCPICLEEDEDVDHVFFKCGHAMKVWTWFRDWSGILNSFFHLVDEVKNRNADKKSLKFGLALSYMVLWTVWKMRNNMVFKKRKVIPMNTADAIQLDSYNWIKLRANCGWIRWQFRCVKPYFNDVV